MKLAHTSKQDRPREKLKTKGALSLSDLELLQALIGSGNAQADVTQISKNVLRSLKQKGSTICYEDVVELGGIGPAKATEIIAAFELARRYLIKPDQPIIDSTEKAAQQLDFIRNKKQEYFVVMTLDGANRMIAKRVITIGTLTASLVHPCEVFAEAITDRAASIVIAHNHPSGILSPSEADIKITNRIKKSGETLGINLTDHVIVTNDNFSSIL